MEIPIAMSKIQKIPIIFYITDDWPKHLYTHSATSWPSKIFAQYIFRKLIAKSSLRYVVSNEMLKEYKRRYKENFHVLSIPAESAFKKDETTQKQKIDDSKNLIIYSGSLALNRWKSIEDLCRVITENPQLNVDFHIYSPDKINKLHEKYSNSQSIKFYPALSDHNTQTVISQADILLIAESFDDEYMDYIKLSISSKISVYLQTGKPILVYAPDTIATTQYALSSGWGYVVHIQSDQKLKSAIGDLLYNKNIIDRLYLYSKKSLEFNHDAESIRKRLLKDVMQLIEKNKRRFT